MAGRTQHGLKVNFPGRGVETVALSRIKPAFVSDEPDEYPEDPQDLDEERPPSPPPPGRKPGWRTRQPEPTSRQTRQSARRQLGQTPSDVSVNRWTYTFDIVNVKNWVILIARYLF